MRIKIQDQLVQVGEVHNHPNQVFMSLRLPMICLVQKFVVVQTKNPESQKEERLQISVESADRLDIFANQSQQHPTFEAMLQKQEHTCSDEPNKDGAKQEFSPSSEMSKECYGVSHTFRLKLEIEGCSQSGGQLDKQTLLLHQIDTVRVFAYPCFKM